MGEDVSSEYAYRRLLGAIKQQVKSAQARTAFALNSELLQLYWNLGRMITENQSLFEGRNNYVEQLAKDLRSAFPETKGFSRSNLFYMRKFYQFYAGNSVQQPVGLNATEHAELSLEQPTTIENPLPIQQAVGFDMAILGVPWGHHVLLLNKVESLQQAHFYLQQTIDNNWTRAILALQIEQDLFSRQGKAMNNFQQTLPERQAQMAGQILKDPYNFGFLSLEPQVQELEVEKQLTEHITKFLLELGKGFAFIGRQYPLQVGSKDYRLDLLFYHIRLRCYVVIDLKVVEFEPEFAGKMNFYLSVLDDQIRTADDQPSIGIILCKNKNKLEVEYALRGLSKPIGVSEFMVTQALPEELNSTLPTVEEFERELKNELE